MTDRPTDIDDVLNHRRDACQKPLDMSDAAQKAFADRQEKLIRSKRWPILNWYNDDDFCRAYNTAVALKAERDAQAAELARLRRLEEAASTMYYTNHGSPEWDTAYNMLMEAIDEREEAAREAKKARNA